MFQLYQNPTVKTILDMLSEGKSFSVKQIEHRLGVSRQLVEYHLKKLQDQHVIDAIDEEPRLYFLVEMQRRVFLKCKEYFAARAMA
ncbi:MAG: winged helix-turn-helix domain-containing protein [Candidatus Sigynarchaeota archaeon]